MYATYNVRPAFVVTFLFLYSLRQGCHKISTWFIRKVVVYVDDEPHKLLCFISGLLATERDLNSDAKKKISNSRNNRPLPSSKNAHFQSETKCTAFLVKMSFICMRMKNHFHIKGWALNLVLIQRPENSEMAYWRKWRNITLKETFLHEKSIKTGGKANNYEQPLLACLFYLTQPTRNAKTDFVTHNPCSSRISINRSRNGIL